MPCQRLPEASISIHAPRVGSDLFLCCDAAESRYFYPRSPRGERRHRFTSCTTLTQFLSTLPAWGATAPPYKYNNRSKLFLSTLPAWGATPAFSATHSPQRNFYPRSPRGERLSVGIKSGKTQGNFYPRSPRGERLWAVVNVLTVVGNFYPRSPRGERRAAAGVFLVILIFLSTLPAWGATMGAW